MTPNAKHKLTLVCTALALCLSTTSAALAACLDPAGPNVDWVGCDKQGADLSVLNLTGANLSGANLTGVDLSGSILVGTNLEGATLEGVILTGTDLNNATWWNGNICAAGSIGECK